MTAAMFSPEAEKSVLGSLMIDEKTHGLINEISPDDFAKPAHREIYSAIVAVRDDGRVPDLVTVDEKLSTRGTLDGVGGAKYLVEIVQGVPTTTNVRSYVDILLKHSNRRKAHALAQDMIQKIESDEELAVVVLEAADALRGIQVTGGRYVHISDALIGMYDGICQTRENKKRRITTGIGSIDALFKGFRNGRLTILGAPTSVGKSALGMAFAMHIARDGWKVAYFSLEMTDEEYAQRMVSSVTSLTATQIDDGDVPDEKLAEISQAMGALSTLDLRFVQDVFTIEEIFARAQWMTDQGLIDFLVIDHMHLIHSAKNFQSDTQKTKYISQKLKHLAMTIDRPVLAMAQISRASVTRQDKRPVLTDLRDSSSIEQDANNVLMMHRYESPDEPGLDAQERETFANVKSNGGQIVSVRCLKQRQGKTFDTNIVFYPAHMRFTDIERRRDWG